MFSKTKAQQRNATRNARKRRAGRSNLFRDSVFGRDAHRSLGLESLETRSLMAVDGPQLFGLRPDQDELLNVYSTQVLRTAPNELRLLFKGGADIDPTTVANGVRIIRSGFDNDFVNNTVSITPAYIALGDNGADSNSIVMRFTDPLPDDRYRVQVFSQDVPATTFRALRDTSGDPLVPTIAGTDRDTVEFDLDLGAKVIAVVPQPVTRVSGALQQASDTVVVYLNDDNLNPTLAGSPTFYRLINTSNTLTATDDVLFLPTAVTYSSTTDTATLRFDNDNNIATAYSLPAGTWRLDVGVSDEPNDLAAKAVRVGALYNAAPFNTLSYLGDSDSTSTNTADVDLYRVSLRAGATVTISVAPNAGLDAVVRLLRADGTTVVATTATSTGGAGITETLSNTAALPATEDYFVEVRGAGATVGGYRVSISVPTPLGSSDSPGTTDDDDSSFATANSIGILGDTGFSVSATIAPPTLLLPPYPGGNDEPGHRQLTPDPHSVTEGLTPVAANDIETQYYNFALVDPQNTDANGNPYPNLITEEEKQLVREIYEVFQSVTGIRFVEDTVGQNGTRVMVGDLRAAVPTAVNGPAGAAGLGGPALVVLDALEPWGAYRKYGSSFFETMFHEIGHSLGLGHSYDVPSLMGGDFTIEQVYPGDADVIHLNRLYRPDNIDIDLYKFSVAEAGTFSAEVFAERAATTSLLDSVLRLYRENLDGTRELVAQNDNYFSDDSFLELALEPGTYYIGVSSVGNDQYNPEVLNSGFGGRSQGDYQLRLNHLADPARSLQDTTGNSLDGDGNGLAGGQFQFWFRTGNTLFVDKVADTIPNVAQGNGTLATPFDNIASALAAATPNTIVRIVGNGGTDGDITTVADNRPYLVGFSNTNAPLADGSEFLVPSNVTVMIDAGALVKLRLANIDVGTGTIDNNRAGGALQVLGTPTTPVLFRSFRDDTAGGDSDGFSSTGARPGDWGGLVFRDDSDRESQGVFLNWVANASLNHGGGKVFVGSKQSVYTPIHLVSARPTVIQNTITNSADAAMSADPNSFDDQIANNTDKRLRRIGPEIYGNRMPSNTVNGLFVRIETDLGKPLDKLDVTARFDDTDITHVITENLVINGNAGGARDSGLGQTARTAGRLRVDPGIIVKLGNSRIEAERGSSSVIAEGTTSRPVIFTSVNDDRYGTGGTFDTNGDGATTSGARGDWGGFFFSQTSSGSFDHAVITYAGGRTPIEGDFANFAPIEVHQARLRLTNSLLENNGSGADSGNRNGRTDNVGSTVFVRGAQPVIVNNLIQNNAGPAIHINVNSLDAVNRKDPGRSTAPVGAFTEFSDNYGPLIRLNKLDNNASNGLEIRADELTTESVWDDTDIVHIVRGEIEVATSQNHHTYSGLRLQSSAEASLVVKLSGANAGFTVNGELHELDDRIGGAVQVLGTIGHPVILTALTDCSVGAGFKPDGRPQNDTIPGGACGSSVVTVAPGFADVLVVIDESSSMGPLQDFTEQMIPELENALIASGVGDGTFGTNRYGLVGYGGPNTAFGFSYTVGSGQWGTSTEYVTAALGLRTQSGAADGYKGLDFALANYAFRGAAAKFIILITDTNRENFGGAGLSPSTTSSLLAQLSAADITLQTIVNARFRDSANNIAIAVDSTGTAFLPDGSGGYTTSSGGFADPTFASGGFGGAGRTADIINSYINLGWGTGGISGSIQPISDGGDDQVSFVAAFADSIVEQTQEPVSSTPGEWRSIQLGQYSNDRNVAVVTEREPTILKGNDDNRTPATAQDLGVLAPNEKSGDENRRLGFEVLGRIAYDAPTDQDVYSFTGTAGTPVWIDIDRTDSTLDTRVELITFSGTVTAGSDNSLNNTEAAPTPNFATLTGSARPLLQNIFLSEDNYTLNPKDAGFYTVLPGTAGQTGTYFVRVSSDGKTSGHYQLQIRLRQQDEEPGSTIDRADIRFATTGIEVIGLPARSNLAAESGENGDAGGTSGAAQNLGNLMSSDRNTVSVGGQLGSGADVDFYNFDLTMGQIQRIAGINANTTVQWPLTFDVDYADGLVRPDSTLSVFDEQGRLILVGRESSIADDQPASSSTLSLDDLSRGSVGKLDPFIGPVIMNEGTSYTFAVTSNQQMPIQLQQFAQAVPANPLTRLEPLESVARVVEDHIGTSGFVAANLLPVAPQTAVFNIDTVAKLDTHIVPFTLDDVRLYISNNDQIFSIDAQSARNRVTVGSAVTGNERLRDITIRTDGRLFGYRDRDSDNVAFDNDIGNTAGAIVNYDPGNAAPIGMPVDDGIRGPAAGAVFAFTPAVNASDVTYTDSVEALTYRRNSYVNADSVDYDLFLSVNDPLAGAPTLGTGYSKLFVDLDGPPDGAVNQSDTTVTNRGFVAYIGGARRGSDTVVVNGASITFIASRAGTAGDGTELRVIQNGGNSGGNVGNGLDVQAVGGVITVTVFNDSGNRSLTAQQLVDAINANVNARAVGIAQLNSNGGNRISNGTGSPPNPSVGNPTWSTSGGVNGSLLGRTTGMAFLGGTLYGVSDAGEFFTINTANGNANVLRTYAGTNFQGLALGPQNLDANRDRTPEYADFLFAITANGQLRAIDTNSVNSDPAIFAGGATTLDTGVANPTGLAFSNLDFNLWHPTTQLGDVPGHGINPTFNNSRPPVAGGTSFYFGLENFAAPGFVPYDVLNVADGQFGVSDAVHRDLSTNPTNRNTYDLPGGAKGKLLTDPFSLASIAPQDMPTLYFNYLLQTQGADGAMSDSARVFISQDGGTTWELVASNNSVRGNEIAPVYTHNATSNPAADPNSAPTTLQRSDIVAQQVQELFDTNPPQWRQARVDLAAYAGRPSLRLRFDFATAGAIDEPGLPGEANGSLTSNARGQFNRFAGFYVDDIIVGMSERGELVTNASLGDTRMTATNIVPEPAPPQQLAGAYQVEVRRGAEYGGNTYTYNAEGINRVFDTNDRLVQEDAFVAATPPENFNRTALRTGGTLPWQTGGFTDWTIVSNRANANLSTIGIFDVNDPLNSEYTVLQISLETQAGNVTFQEISVGLADAIFFIDGVNVDRFLETGDPVNGAQTYPVTAGLHTFTWVGAKAANFGIESTTIDDVSFPAQIAGTGDKGDDNFFREQGQLILRNNKIISAAQYGISVTAGSRNPNPTLPHPGVPINFNTLNTNRWVPGVVIENNILATNGTGGVRFAGDNAANPAAVTPYGRIVNNTFYGGRSPSGNGIDVTNNASPTILNNIFANTVNAITTTGAGTVVIGSNLFHNNTSPTAPTDATAGTSPLFALDTDPLFNNVGSGVFYLANGTQAIDSSLNLLQDRAAMMTVKTPLGIPPSSVVAPDFDLYGQLRLDDTTSDPLGGGSSIFKDRGAVEASDSLGPYAQLLSPLDNDPSDEDFNTSVLFRRNGLFTEFAILLSDGAGSPFANEGTGVDPNTVINATTRLSSTIVVKQDGVLLEQNVAYRLGYSNNNQTLLLTPLSEVWEPNHVYEIELKNLDPVFSIRDYAGNPLRGNQADGSMKFTIVLGDLTVDYGDAPSTIGGIPTTYPTTLAQDGARHVQLLGGTPLLLGTLLDTEDNAVPTALANGDDRIFALSFSTTPASTLTLVGTAAPPTQPWAFRVPAGSGGATVGVVDGETFTINDQVNAPVTFEIELSGGLTTAGAVGIAVVPTRDTPEDVAAAIAAAIQSRIDAGALFDVRPRSVGDVVSLTQFGIDDEEGLNFTNTVFNADTNVTDFVINSTGSGFVDAWIDFNNDGTWQNAEQILTSFPVVAGSNAVSLNDITPAGSFVGLVNARFRLSPLGGLTTGGIVAAGEVEDYQIAILPGVTPNAVDDTFTVSEDGLLNVPASGVLANDTDADSPSDSVVGALLISGPSNAAPGGFTLNADGSFNYRPASEFSGIDTFVYRARDSVGLLSNNRATVTITVLAANDPPTNVLPPSQWIAEDAVLSFSSSTSTAISVLDDANATQAIDVTLTATGGVISLNRSFMAVKEVEPNSSFSTAQRLSGAGWNTLFDAAIGDRLANTSTSLAHLTVNGNGDGTRDYYRFNVPAGGGRVILDIDNASTGLPGSFDSRLRLYNSFFFQIDGNDDALSLTDGAAGSISLQDAYLETTLAAGDYIVEVLQSSGSAPAAGQSYQLQISVANHALALDFLQGDGDSDAVQRIRGNTTFVNAALDGLFFAPTANFNGTATLVVATDDLGNWHDAPNSGASLFDTDTLTISVLAVNDAPVLTIPATQFVREDEPLLFSVAGGNPINLVDVDVLEATPRDTAAGVGVLELKLDAVNGLMTFTAATLPAGLVFLVGDGTADSTMTIRGTPAELNVALDGLRFDGFPNYSGAASISFAVRDFGNRGAGVVAAEATVQDQSASAAFPFVTNSRIQDGSQFTINNGVQDYVFVMDSGPEVLQNVNETTSNASPNRVVVDGNFFLLDPDAAVSDDETLFQMDTGPVFVVLDATSLFNQTVSVTGAGGTRTYEFVPSGGKALTTGATAVDISGNLTPEGVAGFLRDAINAGTSGVTASAVGERVSFANDTAVQSNTANISVVGNAGIAPIIEAVRGNQLNDGRTFRLQFAGGSTFTFEFDTGFGGVTPGNIAVPFTSGDSVVEVASAIRSAIDGSGAPVTTQLVTDIGGTYGRILVNGANVTFSPQTSPLTNLVTRLSPRVFTVNVEESFTASQVGAAVAQRVVQATSFMASADGGRINFPPAKVAPPAIPAARIATAGADFNGVPVWVDMGSTTGVQPGAIAVPFWAEDSADEVARQLKAAIDSAAILGVTTVQTGAAVVVNGLTAGGITTSAPFAGGGGPQFASGVVPIAIAAVNDEPQNYLQGLVDFASYIVANPAPFTMNEDSTLTFSAATNNRITIDDPADGTTQSVRVTLTATNGVVTLPSSAGLTFPIAGQDGIADPTVTFEGTIATINARLNGLIFRPNANFDGLAQLTINTNDRGFVGADGPKSDEDVINITVLPLNDAPSNIVPGIQSVAEDTALLFSSLTSNPVRVNDDAGTLDVDVLFTVTNGTLTLGSTTGITTVLGNGTGNLSLVGPLNAINAALQTLSFRGNQDFNGQAIMVMRSNDLGNAGGVTPQIDTDTVTINVTPVNDPPVNLFNGLPAFGIAATTDEDPVTLSAAGNNRLSISDVDAGSGIVRVTLTGGSGVVTLGSRSGLTFTVGDGTADPVMTFSGTIAAINTALASVTFRPDDFFSGDATLTVTTSDQGLTGAGGIQIDSDTVTITVTAVNDPPVNTVPGQQTFNEDLTRVFSAANGNRITVSDDAITTNSPIRVDVAVVDTSVPSQPLGTLALGPVVPSGLTVTALPGGAIQLQGLVGDINTALNGLTFTPPLNFNGQGVLSVTTNDLGNSPFIAVPNIVGSTVALNITAVNDAPVNTVPAGPLDINEDTTVNFTAGQWAVSDADAGTGSIRVTLAATLGTLSLAPSTLTALTFVLGTGIANSTMVFEGTIPNVNAALNTLSFVPTSNLSGDAVITITSDDLGLTGSGGALTDTDALTITIAPINDAPTITVPAPQSANEDSVFQFTAANAITIVDDAGPSEILATIAVTNGVATLNNIAGLAAPPTGQGTATIDVRGSLAAINTALASLSFTPTANFAGNAVVTVTANDQGNTGGGPNLSGSGSLTIAVQAINDAPVNTVPGAQSIPEDLPLSFDSVFGNVLAVTDIDSGTGSIRVQLSAVNGLLTLSTTAGLSFAGGAGDGVDDSTMSFTGTLAAVNTALDGLRFVSATDFFGNASLTITSNDLGNTGNGGPLADTDTIAITVTSVNDPPRTAPLPRAILEDNALTLGIATLIVNDVPGPANEAGQTLAFSGVDPQSANGGTVVVQGANVIYTPPLNFPYASTVPVADTFTYIITDNGTTNGISEPKSSRGTVTVTVTPVNDAPTAVNDSYTMDEDTVLTRAAFNGVRANDTDPEGGTLSVSRISGPTATGSTNGGTLTLGVDGSFTYTPPVNYFGTVTFTYRVNDGQLNSNTATVTITVNNVNEPPVAVADSATTSAGRAIVINVLANDTDVDGTLNVASVNIASNPANGTAVPGADGRVTYTPSGTFQGVDTFQYTVRDNTGAISNAATVTITVGPALPAYQNTPNRLDVNNDTFVTPIDALFVINYLNTVPGGSLPPVGSTPPATFWDVNGNNIVDPQDALLVINRLNTSSGEGELANEFATTAPTVEAAAVPAVLAAPAVPTLGSPTVAAPADFAPLVVHSGLASTLSNFDSANLDGEPAFALPTASGASGSPLTSAATRRTAGTKASLADPAGDAWTSIADELASELSSDVANASSGSSNSEDAADAALADLFGE